MVDYANDETFAKTRVNFRIRRDFPVLKLFVSQSIYGAWKIEQRSDEAIYVSPKVYFCMGKRGTTEGSKAKLVIVSWNKIFFF